MESLPRTKSRKKFIELEKSEYVNVQIIDEQHKKFAELIDELYELLGLNKPETTKYILNQLITELQIHFNTEETFMKETKYVNFFSHKMEHDRFLKKIEDFRNGLLQGTDKLNLELLKSCKTWFHNHIKLNDKKLGDFLVEQNIQ